MKRIIRGVCIVTGISIAGCFSSQQFKDNAYGACLSIKSSFKSALIVYQSYQDYQASLNHIPYNSQQYHQARHQVHLRVANRILKLSKENRGIYLKLGQYLGNLDKVVPWEFIQVLKVLQDTAPPIPYSEMKTIFDTDLKHSSQEIFSQIDQKPLASASLAQVHRGRLASNGQQVAIKMQYPFLRVQSKWDLFILKHLTNLCSYLSKSFKNSNFDFVKLFQQWTSTLVEELDFSIQTSNALRAKQNFKHSDKVYIPHIFTEFCSTRLIVMEYVQGLKITQKDEMIQQGIDLKAVRLNLLNLFTEMIFKYGFIHCDAHPGNIFIRPKNNSVGHQIVLLDHGLYRNISPETIHNFSGLLVYLLLQDRKNVIYFAQKLNIHSHFQYIPIIFFQRLRNSTKKIGQDITPQEKKQFRDKDLASFDSIYKILHDLPPEIMYIIRTFSLVSAHFSSLGGSRRQRIFMFADSSLKILYRGKLSYRLNHIFLVLRVWFFEMFPSLYRYVFGTL